MFTLVVCGVLAVTKWKGWYLGVMESINCAIIVGFSWIMLLLTYLC